MQDVQSKEKSCLCWRWKKREKRRSNRSARKSSALWDLSFKPRAVGQHGGPGPRMWMWVGRYLPTYLHYLSFTSHWGGQVWIPSSRTGTYLDVRAAGDYLHVYIVVIGYFFVVLFFFCLVFLLGLGVFACGFLFLRGRGDSAVIGRPNVLPCQMDDQPDGWAEQENGALMKESLVKIKQHFPPGGRMEGVVARQALACHSSHTPYLWEVFHPPSSQQTIYLFICLLLFIHSHPTTALPHRSY